MDDDDTPRDTAPAVIGAVAAGVVPLPFLAVYALLFIGRGTVRPVVPPDIGSGKGDELIAGLVALALFILGCYTALTFLNARRRWPFVLFQAATLGGCCYLISDPTTGSASIPVLLVITSLLALGLAGTPAAWEHLRRDVPPWLRRRGGERRVEPEDSALPVKSPDVAG